MKRKEDPEKLKAQYKVMRALKSGLLVKPQICSECNKRKFTTGHHEDYTKPLQVIWLCFECHGRLHSRIKHRKRYEALVELSKITSKAEQNYLMKQPTKTLTVIMELIRSTKYE